MAGTVVNGVDYAFIALTAIEDYLDKRTIGATHFTVEQITGTMVRVTATNATSGALITKLDVTVYPSPPGA